MPDVRELYQQLILEHNKKPRNYGILEPHSHMAEGYNPLCGDRIDVYLNVQDGVVQNIQFHGSGCAISQASSSLMTTHVKGKPTKEAQEMVDEFRAMIRGELDPEKQPHHLGRLTIFQGVKDLPARVKCAVLPWTTLHSALQGEKLTSTE